MREPVSVIIPARNAAGFLDAALGSVFAQDWPVEVVVVDDGSTDDIQGALRPYAGRIRLMRQEARGLPAARNAGLRLATAGLVLFLDADDVLGEGLLAGQVQALDAAGGVGVPVCLTRFFSGFGGDGAPVAGGWWRRFPERLDIHLCHFNVAPPLAFLARREAALAAGGFDEGLGACEDYDFWLRMQAAGHAPFPGADAVAWYRRHPGSMSSNLERQRRHDRELHLRVARLLESGAPGFGDAPATRRLACCAGMLLTSSRLPAAEAEPLLPGLLRLLEGTSAEPDSCLHEFFLLRCLMLHAAAGEADAPAPVAVPLGRQLERLAAGAGRGDWLRVPAEGLAARAAAMEDALHAAGEPARAGR